MTTQQKLDWTEGTPSDAATGPGRRLWVSDGTAGHYTSISGNVAEALDDYAAGYRCDPQSVTVSWVLFQDGEEEDRGRHTFEVA